MRFLFSRSALLTTLMLQATLLGPYLVLRAVLLVVYPGQTLLQVMAPETEAPTKKHYLIAQMEERLEKYNPKVVIVGSSLATRGVDPKQLADILNLPEDDVLILWSPAATFPTVYTIIKERVFANGYRPELVIVATSPRWFVTNTTVRKDLLLLHHTNPDPYIDQLIEQQGLVQSTFQQQKGEFRATTLGTVRALFGDKPFGLSAEESSERLDELFSFDNRREVSNTSILPVTVDGVATQVDIDVELVSLPDIEDVLFPRLVELTQQHQANFMFVELPVRVNKQAEHYVPTDYHLQMIQTLRASGAGYFSFLDVEEQGIFADPIHLNPNGRQLLSKKLKEQIDAIDPLGAVIVPAKIPAFLKSLEAKWSSRAGPVTDRRELPERDWLNPRSAVDLRVSNRWKPSLVEIRVYVGKSTQYPDVFLEGRRLRLDENVVENGWWTGTGELPLLKKGMKIRIENNSSTQMFSIASIRVDETEVFSKQPRVSLWRSENVVVERADNPLTIPIRRASHTKIETGLHPDLFIGELGPFAMVTEEQLTQRFIAKISTGTNCIPIELQIPQQELPVPVTHKNFVRGEKTPMEHAFFEGEVLLIVDSDVDLSNGTISIREEARNCAGGKWLYPNEQLDISFPETSLRQPVSTLGLVGHTFGAGSWTVELLQGDNVKMQQTFDNLEFQKGFWLEEPLLQVTSDMSLRITGNQFLHLSDVQVGSY